MLKKSVFAIVIMFLAAFTSNAQVPQIINYQAMLTDAQGNPINGVRSIQFRIYNALTDGSELWTETQTVTITEGIFNVLLGSITPIPYNVFNGDDRYISLQVESDPEMTPRKRLVSVGYAFRAYNADRVDGLSASAFVQQIDGVEPNSSGNIDLVAGSNISITPNTTSNSITITSSGGSGGGDITAVNAGDG